MEFTQEINFSKIPHIHFLQTASDKLEIPEALSVNNRSLFLRNFTIPTLCCHSFATPVKHKTCSFVHHF